MTDTIQGEIVDTEILDEEVPLTIRQVAEIELTRKKNQQRHYRTKHSVKTVIDMASIGMPQEDIANILSITPKVLRKHYRHELDVSLSIASSQVGGRLYSKAMSGDVACLIFWAKTRMGWKEGVDVNVSGKDGNPLKMIFEVVPIAVENSKNTVTNDTPLLSNDRSESS